MFNNSAVNQLLRTILLIIFFLSTSFLHSCSSSHNQALRHELSGRGLLPLDIGNPYLAPNMFLSEEAKTSETLKGFLSLKGAPEFLEFSDPIIGRPSLTLIYKSKSEAFHLEEHGNNWIISGPVKSESEIVAGTQKSILEDNIIQPTILPSSNTLNTNQDNVAGIKTELPKSGEELKKESDTPPSSSRPTFKDVYHEVNFVGQTMTFVAYYYTGSINNSDRIRRINASLQENLRIGDIVRVPSYLSQKDAPPTQEDLNKFIHGTN